MKILGEASGNDLHICRNRIFCRHHETLFQ